jgi:hypothetical protein
MDDGDVRGSWACCRPGPQPDPGPARRPRGRAGAGQVAGEGAPAGPDLDDGVPRRGSRASTILRWRFGSTRKFWPRRRLARTAQLRTKTAVRSSGGTLRDGRWRRCGRCGPGGLGLRGPPGDDLGQQLLLSTDPGVGEGVGQAVGEEEEQVARAPGSRSPRRTPAGERCPGAGWWPRGAPHRCRRDGPRRRGGGRRCCSTPRRWPGPPRRTGWSGTSPCSPARR